MSHKDMYRSEKARRCAKAGVIQCTVTTTTTKDRKDRFVES